MKSISVAAVLIVVLVTASGLAIRVDRISQPDGALGEDEARLVLAAQGVLETGLPTMPSGKLYFRGVVSSYLTAASLWAFGRHDFAARLPNAIAGALLAVVLFLFGRALAGTAAGLCAATFATFQPDLIDWSTNAWMTSLFVVLFMTAAYLLFLGFEQDRPRMQVAGAFAAVGAMLSHELGALTAGAVVATVALRILRRDLRWFAGRATLVAFLILGVGLLLFVLLGLQLRAATLSGAGGEFRFYYGPSFSPDRFLVDLERWRSGYLPMLVAAVLSVVLFVGSRCSRAQFLHATIAVTGLAVWVVISKRSERYGLVLFPLMALAGGWASAEIARLLSRQWRLPETRTQILAVAVLLVVFAPSVVADARRAVGQWSTSPGRTWLEEFRALGPAPGDLIMSDDPEIPAVYLGPVQYWERGSNFERYSYEEAGHIRHLYTGALRVSTEEEFRRLLQSNPGKTLWYIGRADGASPFAGVIRTPPEVLHVSTVGETVIAKFLLGRAR